ncbi:hypothetical protein Hanom_Chr06g00542651 [Helianthus anomalus]
MKMMMFSDRSDEGGVMVRRSETRTGCPCLGPTSRSARGRVQFGLRVRYKEVARFSFKQMVRGRGLAQISFRFSDSSQLGQLDELTRSTQHVDSVWFRSAGSGLVVSVLVRTS